MDKSDVNHRGSVMITGGSGMIGKYLTSLLLSDGYKVAHLSRDENQFGKVRVFRWDPEKGILDPEFLRGYDYIVHLAGVNLGEKRWTSKRRKEILDSRVKSARLIYETVRNNDIRLKAFITASAIGIYGAVSTEKIYSEKDSSSHGFLAGICRQWEEAADLFSGSGARIVKIRAAMVLERHDSSLTRLINPARFGIVLRLGNGKQYFPWIHINDLSNIYLKAIKDENIQGVYNAVAPHYVRHNEFMKTLASVMNRPVFLPPVPGFLLNAVYGEMADVLIKGSRVSSKKIINAGYRFVFDNLHYALKDVIQNQ